MASLLADQPKFIEVTAQSGLTFTHQNGMQGQYWLPEIMGSGIGVLDFDGDGLLDLWLVQGGVLGKSESSPERFDSLYKNLSSDGRIRFKRLDNSNHPSRTSYGMGVATGDIDNDGDLDVFLANLGSNRLMVSGNNGIFTESSAFSSVAGESWSVAGSFADFNGDGWIDLYVVNYVDFDFDKHKPCFGISPFPDYCAPSVYPPATDQLLMNQGDGTFRDATSDLGIGVYQGRGLGAITSDFNQDMYLDIYVANDPKENFLWQFDPNTQKFINVALTVGASVNGNGKSEASMGLAVGDPDEDCDLDLFMTNLTGETNTYLRNSGEGVFLDTTNLVGLGSSSFPYTGFGTSWTDIELDGDLDLLVVNGAVTSIEEQRKKGESLPLRQRNQLWINDGSSVFTEFRGEDIVEQREVSRGLVLADFDNDGDQDVVFSNNNSSVRLYENNSDIQDNWVGVEVRRDKSLSMHAIVRRQSRNCDIQVVRTDGSYASSVDPRLVFGLGDDTSPQHFNVLWRDGSESTHGPLEINQYHRID